MVDSPEGDFDSQGDLLPGTIPSMCAAAWLAVSPKSVPSNAMTRQVALGVVANLAIGNPAYFELPITAATCSGAANDFQRWPGVSAGIHGIQSRRPPCGILEHCQFR